MGQLGNKIRTVLYRNLSLDNYLKVLSSAFLAIYKVGAMKNAPEYEYPYFLKNIVDKDDTVIDIGANLGYYCYIFASLVGAKGSVYAVEPVTPIFRILRHNVRKYKNITLHNCALGAENKLISMGNDSINVNGYFGTGQNFVVDRPTLKTDVTFDAQMKIGTELFADLEHINFIKCDIEGYENVVIPQLMPLIEKHRPRILIETGSDTRRMIIKLLTAMDYSAFVLDGAMLKELTCNDTKDIIFIPNAQVKRYKKLTK